MAYLATEDRDDAGRSGRNARAARAATLVTRLQAMQRQINAKNFAVLRTNGRAFLQRASSPASSTTGEPLARKTRVI